MSDRFIKMGTAAGQSRNISFKTDIDATYSLTVPDPRQEVHLKVAYFLKNASLGKDGGLTPMPHEKWCMTLQPGQASTVEPALLTNFNAARISMMEMLEAEGASTLEEVIAALNRNQDAIMDFDDTVCLEYAYANQCAEAAFGECYSRQDYC